MDMLFLSTSDSGGAGKAAYQIYLTLKKYHNCQFVVFRKETTAIDVQEVNRIKFVGRYIRWFIEKSFEKLKAHQYSIDKKYDMLNLSETLPLINLSSLFSKISITPDLIILNWISGFINSHDIKAIYKKYKVPILWFLHDYAPLTGGCHIAWDCLGYTMSCGKCPGINSVYKYDTTHRILINKSKNLKEIPVYTTGWSDYILSKSKKSTLFKNNTLPAVTPAFNELQFTPANNKRQSKNKLNIPGNRKVILFGSQNVFSIYKGFHHLISALKLLPRYLKFEIGYQLVTFGRADDQVNDQIEFPWLKLGFIDDPSIAYQAADVFVAPTLQDTGPMTICESLLCGTPVIGYPMGIIPKLIRDEETGFIVEEGNIELLASRIAKIFLMDENSYEKLSENCRKTAMEKCSEEAQLKSFEELFKILNLNNTSNYN